MINNMVPILNRSILISKYVTVIICKHDAISMSIWIL